MNTVVLSATHRTCASKMYGFNHFAVPASSRLCIRGLFFSGGGGYDAVYQDFVAPNAGTRTVSVRPSTLSSASTSTIPSTPRYRDPVLSNPSNPASEKSLHLSRSDQSTRPRVNISSRRKDLVENRALVTKRSGEFRTAASVLSTEERNCQSRPDDHQASKNVAIPNGIDEDDSLLMKPARKHGSRKSDRSDEELWNRGLVDLCAPTTVRCSLSANPLHAQTFPEIKIRLFLVSFLSAPHRNSLVI